MKSANALLELPATALILTAGTSVSAILIADISSFPLSKMVDGMTSVSLHQGYVSQSNITTTQLGSSSQELKVKVAILTVSDTVASGAGPDRR